MCVNPLLQNGSATMCSSVSSSVVGLKYFSLEWISVKWKFASQVVTCQGHSKIRVLLLITLIMYMSEVSLFGALETKINIE